MSAGMRERLGAPPAHVVAIGLCFVAACWHQSWRWDWYIDDSAICFAYARNLAHGLGWVPWPGGERVEAVSDPTWVLLLAAFQLVGLTGFTVAKPLAMLFGGGTLALVYRTARRALPSHAGHGALIAPIALALNAQFAIWSASGLENALFCLLLAAAVDRVVVECESADARPWSAALYVLLALTRPEGLMYAAFGGVVLAIASRRAGRSLAPLALWGAALVAPILVVEAWRLWYFAWPLPNTFYAKIASRGVEPLEWGSRGWNQLRDWAGRLWHGYFAPVYLVGLTGLEPRALRIGGAVVAGIGLTLLWPGTDALRALWWWPELPDPPTVLLFARVIAILLAGAGLPLLALRSEAPWPRLLCGWTVFGGLAFSVYASGDWMGAYRFMSLVAPALSVLFAVGATTSLDAFERASQARGPVVAGAGGWSAGTWVAASVATGLLVPPNFAQTEDHVYFNRNETTASVKLRADYTRSILRRTFWTEPVTNIEVDQGAHLWWAPDYREVDMAMLVDVPMARHWFQQRDFVREYVFEEMRPTFGHVGGWWAEHSGLRKYPEWEPTFFELPGYQNLPPMGWFRNVFARRELVMAEGWGDTARRARFDWDLELVDAVQPAPWVAGQPGYLEVPFRVTRERTAGQDVALTAFLARDGKVVASFSLPMGYGFYPMDAWKTDQVFRGRHAVPVPGDLPPGRYDLGFLVTGPRGGVVPVVSAPEGAVVDPPALAAGEVRFPGAVQIVSLADLVASADAARAAALDAASRGDCEEAERAWVRLQRHHPVDWDWQEAERPTIARGLADCWARRAEHAGSRAVDLLARSHRWDPDSSELARVGGPVGDALWGEGKAARAASDWETAYERFAALLRFQPWRAWARRYAEEARDERLGLTDDVRIGIGGDNDLRRVEEEQR